MGTFSVTIRIGDLGGTSFQEVEAMADTGATTTVIPHTILVGLGIKPSRQEAFEYANGQQTRLDMAQATAQAEDGKPSLGSFLAKTECPRCWAPTRWKGCSWLWTHTTSG